MYTIRVEMFARAEPLVFLSEDLEESGPTLEQLVLQMEGVDPDEATDQVFEQYAFDLCSPCRSVLHRGLKAKAQENAER